MRALYIGRFQPFHLGHVHLLREIHTEYPEIILVVGSAQHSHTLENPFTAGERIQMITKTLDEEKITKKVYIIPVDDIHRHAVWVYHIVSLTPAFDSVFSNEPLTTRLFSEAGYTVKDTPLKSRDVWSGTEIRRRIIADQAWEECVPLAVARIIKEIDGVTRLKEIARSDKC